MSFREVIAAFFDGGTREQERLQSADVTHVLTWRPARHWAGETAGLWGLYTLADHLNDRDLTIDFLCADDGIPTGDLVAWISSRLGCPVWLSEVSWPMRMPTESEARFWVRSSS